MKTKTEIIKFIFFMIGRKEYVTIKALDGYYGGSAPAYNIGSFINVFENTTGIQIVPDWLKP
jgi:hypothetical protein